MIGSSPELLAIPRLSKELAAGSPKTVEKAIKNLIKRSQVIRDNAGQLGLCNLPGLPHRMSA
jgi:hypothetical protein